MKKNERKEREREREREREGAGGWEARHGGRNITIGVNK